MSMRTSLWTCHHLHLRPLTLSKTLALQIRQLSEHLTRFLLAPAGIASLHDSFQQRSAHGPRIYQTVAHMFPKLACFSCVSIHHVQSGQEGRCMKVGRWANQLQHKLFPMQYLEELMSTRLGVKRSGEVVSADKRMGPDGREYYDIQVSMVCLRVIPVCALSLCHASIL